MNKLTILLFIQSFLISTSCSIADQSKVADQATQGNNILSRTADYEYGQLKPCPDSPNCINTEYPSQVDHYLPPLSYPKLYANEKNQLVFTQVKSIILKMGGQIIDEHVIDKSSLNKHNSLKTNFYIHAIFTSRFFSFIDDFEVRIDSHTSKVHLRSASRVGYSDFGANKRRVKEFSKLFDSF